ncbi:hypothetical protein M8494_12005 [Serratia ureilytica]
MARIDLDMPADFAHFTVFRRQTAAEAPLSAGTGYIMFTSGSTGMPKGDRRPTCSQRFVDAAINVAAFNRMNACCNLRSVLSGCVH